MKNTGSNFAARDTASKCNKRGPVQICTIQRPEPALFKVPDYRDLAESFSLEVAVAAPWAIIREEFKLPSSRSYEDIQHCIQYSYHPGEDYLY